jgi:hypothetical protein
MARGLMRWFGALLLACVVVGASFLPPRGRTSRLRQLVEPPNVKQAHLRARELADAWREADDAWRLALARERLRPVLGERRARDLPSYALLVSGPDSSRGRAEGTIQPALDSLWARLGLGVTKVSVGLVVDFDRFRGSGAPASSGAMRQTVYLPPDSADRTTCIALVPGPAFALRRQQPQQEEVIEWLRSRLGPCAFYARFGVPGPRVRAWLTRRHFDLASVPAWDRPATTGRMQDWFRDPRTGRWWWAGVYGVDPQGLGCLAGRAAACAAAIREQDVEGAPAQPGPLRGVNPWELRKQPLVGAGWFLSDVVRQAGEDRFQDFWITDLPVDTALTLALREPMGKWAVAWQRTMAPAPPLGAAVAPLDAGLGIGVALALVGALAWGIHRRQVA